MLRLAVLVFSVVAACRALGCSIAVTEVAQRLVRQADVIAEGIATQEQFEFRIAKFWKGSAPETIRVAAGERVSRSCGEALPPTVPGDRYFLIITSEPTAVRVYPAGNDDGLEMFLSGRMPVSRRDLIARLRRWHEGKLSEAAFAQWLREMVPVADVNDWTSDEDGAEYSVALHVMRELHFLLVGSGVSLDELSCELGLFRQRIAPAWIGALEARRIDDEAADAIDALLDEIDERCSAAIR